MAWAWFFLRKNLYESKIYLYLLWSVSNQSHFIKPLNVTRNLIENWSKLTRKKNTGKP
jgi:hypothetical protein